MTSHEPLVLGIETSCDETGVGIVRGTTLLVDTIASSVEARASARAPAAGSNVSRMIARETTTTVQQPIACASRATTSTPMSGLAAHARLATT